MPRSSRRLLSLALGAFAAAALGAPSPSAGWATSFSADAVRAAFSDGPVTVVAGSPSAQVPAAVLADALRRSPRAPRVVDGPRPTSAGWSDERAVEAAVRAGAEQVAVVRVYPGARGSSICTVAIYGRDKAPLRSFYVPQGQPSVRAPAMPSAAARPVQDVARYRDVDEAFVRSHYLAFQETVMLQDGVKTGQIAAPVQGELRKGLWWDEFYRTVGREDLAQKSAALSSLRLTLTVATLASVAAAAAGFYITYATFTTIYEPGVIGPVLGVGGLLGCAGFGLGAATIQPMVAGMEENRRLADEYNQKLKRGEIHGALLPPAPQLQLSLSLAPSAAGLAVRASF